MATQQDDGGVPFAMAHEMQHFRLFELPPEIVELMDAPNPPLFSIKSQAAAATPEAPPAYAVLCTPDRTFELRQVQTSNALFVTHPALDAHGSQIPVLATRAIASCATTLELHPSDASAVALLRDALPVYDLVAGDVDAPRSGKSMATVFDDIPLSDAQCQSAWDELIAFHLQEGSYRPSASALVQVWRSINAAALAEGVKLDAQFLTDDITRAVSEEGHPPALVKAILNNLAKEGEELHGIWSCLDRTKTVAFVGKTLLDAKQGSDYLILDFTDTWVDKLPEAWRSDAQLGAIKDLYELSSQTTIRAKSKYESLVVGSAPGAASKPPTRKWHEKFGKTRKK